MRKVKQMLNDTGGQMTIDEGYSRKSVSKYGVPGATRTPDPLLRRQLLYPTELQGLVANC